MTEDVLRERVITLSKLFKHEFTFRTTDPFDAHLDDELTKMEAEGQVRRTPEGVVLGTGRGGIVVVRFAADGSERQLMADYAPLRRR